MGLRVDLTGKKFSRLRVLGFSHSDSRGASVWRCLCDCGTETAIPGDRLRGGRAKSCGCWKVERAISDATTHGMSKSPEYSVWVSMIQRCNNPKHKHYANYGGRGIKVCTRWMEFENFYADMGPRPVGTTLERKDNDGDYSAVNCKWATRQEQASNRRTNRLLNHNGKTQTISAWARELGIHPDKISNRLNALGWSVEKALTVSD